MAAPDRGFGDAEEFARRCVNSLGCVDGLPTITLGGGSDVLLDSVVGNTVVEDDSARAHFSDEPEDLAMVLAERGGDRAAEEEVLIGVDQEDGFERAPELIDSVRQFGEG